MNRDSGAPGRVLIVDDSATVRAVIRRILESASEIEVIGEAGDGREGVEQTIALQPDVVIMDVDLPVMNGVEASAAITQQCPTPIVVVSSADKNSIDTAFRSMKHGVVGVLPKPGVPKGWEQLKRNLVTLMTEIGPRTTTSVESTAPAHVHDDIGILKWVAIGASTGGPGAVCELIREFGTRFSVGVMVVQHITPGFEAGFSDWLSQELGIKVQTARHNEVLKAGTVRVAPSDHHLRINREGVLELDASTPPIKGHRPSVTILFESLLAQDARTVAAVLLSGMGDDGVDGMVALRKAGAFTVTQSQATCAVYGMPRIALQRGATELAMAPREIGAKLARSMGVGP